MDGVKVFTESTCGMCFCSHKRDGSEGDTPPVGWSTLEIATRKPGAGWSGGSIRQHDVLCPNCTASLKAWILAYGIESKGRKGGAHESDS